MKDRIDLLINILIDIQAPWSDRHDAAIDLGQYNEDSAEQALLKIARNPEEDNTILATCGESLGLIWIRKKKLDLNTVNSLTLSAYDEANAVIRSNKPEWIGLYRLDRK